MSREADAEVVALSREAAGIGEPMVVPGEDVPGTWLGLSNGVSGAHLKCGTGHSVVSALLEEIHDGVASAWLVQHAVANTAADVTHHVARNRQGEADKRRV